MTNTKIDLVELEKQAVKLSRKIEIFVFRHYDSRSGWDREYNRKACEKMERELAKLDANFQDG